MLIHFMYLLQQCKCSVIKDSVDETLNGARPIGLCFDPELCFMSDYILYAFTEMSNLFFCFSLLISVLHIPITYYWNQELCQYLVRPDWRSPVKDPSLPHRAHPLTWHLLHIKETHIYSVIALWHRPLLQTLSTMINRKRRRDCKPDSQMWRRGTSAVQQLKGESYAVNTG